MGEPQNAFDSGRVPDVRVSVRGPKKTGEAHHCFCNIDQQIWLGKKKQS
jgi:hypothetical protein